MSVRQELETECEMGGGETTMGGKRSTSAIHEHEIEGEIGGGETMVRGK